MSAPGRDLLDIATYVGEIALTLEWVGKGLGEAYAEGADLVAARRVALGTLRITSAALAALIAELESGGGEQHKPPQWPRVLEGYETATDEEGIAL